jgi:hypothetical protein
MVDRLLDCGRTAGASGRSGCGCCLRLDYKSVCRVRLLLSLTVVVVVTMFPVLLSR